MSDMNHFLKDFQASVIPDEGLVALLATKSEQTRFNEAKQELLECGASTSMEWLLHLNQYVELLAPMAAGSLADFLERHFARDLLNEFGLVVNPRRSLYIEDDARYVLLMNGQSDRTIDLWCDSDRKATLSIYADPCQLIRVTGPLRVTVGGASRVYACQVRKLFALGFSQVEAVGSPVYQTNQAEVYGCDCSVDLHADPYWVKYVELAKGDPTYERVIALAEQKAYAELFAWVKTVEEKHRHAYDWSSVVCLPDGAHVLDDDRTLLTRDRATDRLFVYGQVTEESLLGEIHRHGMPENASEDLYMLPRLERQRDFIRCYRSGLVPSVSIGGEPCGLRYDKVTDRMELVRPHWGGVIDALPFTEHCSMQENIRLALEVFCQHNNYLSEE